MKALLIGSLSAVVVLAAAHGFAQDVQRPANSPPAFQRVAATSSSVTLSRPMPLNATGSDNLVPALAFDRPAPLFRAKTLDADDLPQLMPVGPQADAASQPGTVKPFGQTETLHQPRKIDSSIEPAPTPRLITTARPRLGRPAASNSISTYDDATVVVPGETILDNGGTCGDSCDTCVSDVCGARWGQRWRNACGACCDDPCCLQRPRGWIRGEYLLWGISSQNLPPLLTGENEPIRGPDQAGVLPVSPILFGEEEAWDRARSGGRVALGFWFPRRCNWGLDGGAFMLGHRATRFEASSDANGSPVMARPYFQPAFGGEAAGEAAQLVSYPDLLSGRISYASSTRLWGADMNLRHRLNCGPRWWLDGFAGYRHVQLNDTLDIREDLTNLQFTPGAGETQRFIVHDHFSTRNRFNGGQIGLEGEVKILRRWFIAGNAKLAIGSVRQIVNIDGSTTFVNSSEGTVTGRGGLYALVSNIGRYERNEFAVVPEFGIKIGFDINDHWRVYAGYNVLYISSVVRAGDQIDRVVNFSGMAPEPTNLNPAIVSPARPAVLFRQSDFWAQGGQFGLEYHW